MIERLERAGIRIEHRAGRAVALPGATDGVVAVVNAAREAGWVIAPWWGGADAGVVHARVPDADAASSEIAGNPSSAAAVHLSTERLAGINEVVPPDLMAVIGAGVTCAVLNARVATDGLYWPGGDVAEGDSAAGDVIARAPGNWTLAGNVLRRYLLGMEVVLADGRVLHTGSRTVKWVTGYDLRQLFVGSRGTLGIVTGLTVRLESLANRDAVRQRYEREFAGLETLGDAPWPAAAVLDDAPVAGSPDVLRLLKAELDPEGVFPAAETAFGAEVAA